MADIKTVTAKEVEELRGQPNVQVVDTRPPFSYFGGRIAGALNLPGTAVNTRVGQIPADRKLIFYDDTVAKATEAAEAALAAGFTDVSVLDGGYDAWLDADLPTETISDGITPPAPPEPAKS
jgi:rhodanese-related sulfurtransferase